MTAIERNLLHGALIDGLTDCHRGGFNDRRGRFYRNDFTCTRQFQAEVLDRILAYLQHQVLGQLRFKTVHLHLNGVHARGQCGDLIRAGAIRLGGALNSQSWVLYHYLGAHDCSATLIGNGSLNARGGLGKCGRGKNQNEQRQHPWRKSYLF